MKTRVRTNSWHRVMYNREFALVTIGSDRMSELARKEVSFLYRTLQLKPGMCVLDVPCGTGRHSLEFARRGLNVTALDINPLCLEMARKQVTREKRSRPKIHFERADMADLSKFRGQFDVTFNLFSSFGYFSTDRENGRVFKQLKSTLQPGGRLVLHLVDRDWLLRVFRPLSWSETGTDYVLDVRQYNPDTKMTSGSRIALNKRTGKIQESWHQMRLYSKPEIVAMARKAGFRKVQVWGGFDGSPYRRGYSTHPIYVFK